MKSDSPNGLARALREFFADHLPRVRGTSPHTLHSYRDTFKLFLRFISSQQKRNAELLDFDNIGPQEVIAFLQHLEDDRRNTPATRNVRLSAIHSFFRYLATGHPEQIERCQKVLSVPFKHARTRSVEYLEYDEIEAVLDGIDSGTNDGCRDYVLMATMFNTGARVQEILDLRPCDLQLVKPFHARLLGKGGKERFCPLLPQTAQLLKALLSKLGLEPASREPLFRNHRGEPLTRFGVRYILAKYCNRAKAHAPTLVTKRLHPHSMRHSTAVSLLQAGVDPITIAHLLGHASVNTTNQYATVDMEMKRKAISKSKMVPKKTGPLLWRNNPSILEWLEAL
jgi:integrase/recombinase XerD